MAQANSGARDEGLGHLQEFVALISDTRRALAEQQGHLDARAEGLAEQGASTSGRLQAFHEVVTGLAESFATTAQATAAELGRLAQLALELGEQVRTSGAEALQSSEARFTAAMELTRGTLQTAVGQLGESFDEIEQAMDRGDALAEAVGADGEEGFLDLASAVAEADSTFSQFDFELQGSLDTATTYILEGLEQYLVTVFNSLFDHLENELPPYLTGLFQDLGRTVHRTLDDYDTAVHEASEKLAADNDSHMSQCVSQLQDGLDDRIREQRASLDYMRVLLEEAERSTSGANKGAQIVAPYPPIVPQLAAAKEVAERVQEMMDVFNPFG
jgi:ABC-type transporter Mla subunit MlaD